MNLYDLHEVVAKLDNLTPENIAFMAAFYGVHVVAALFAARTVVTYCARKFGLYSPTHFRKWPRLPWRPIYQIYSFAKNWYEKVFLIGRRGSTGGFASLLSTLCLIFKSGQIHLGRAYGFGFGWLQPIGIKVSRHLMFLAMTGSGKTTALITIISLWKGSSFIIDPKAQSVEAICQHDTRQWFVFDPDGTFNQKSISINVFDCIKEAMERDGAEAAVLWATRIAEALVVTPSGSKSPYFFDVSRQFLSGLILHVLTHHPEEDHHLPYVRDLIVHGYRVFDEKGEQLTVGDEAHVLLLKIMSENSAFDFVIAGAVAAMQSASGETGGNVRSTLQGETQFLDLPKVRAVLMHSDISLSELKTRDDIVLAFCASIYSLREELSRLSRLLTNMIAYIFEAVKEKKGQCLMVVDELPSQGYNATIEVMLAVSRSMGLTFLGVSQNVELMKKNYPKSWKSFISEADATFWMGGNHPDNAQLLSSILGKKTLIEKDRYSGRKTYREVTVMEPEQITRFLDPDSDNLIVTRAGERALKLKNDPYFKALPVWRYAADPDHKESILRRISRGLFGRKRYPNENNRNQ